MQYMYRLIYIVRSFGVDHFSQQSRAIDSLGPISEVTLYEKNTGLYTMPSAHVEFP